METEFQNVSFFSILKRNAAGGVGFHATSVETEFFDSFPPKYCMWVRSLDSGQTREWAVSHSRAVFIFT